MITNSVRNMISAGAMLATFAVAGYAQDGMRANIGFPFTAQGQKLEAGAYDIRPANIGGAGKFYFVRNLETKKAVVVQSLTVNKAANSAAKDPRLSFQCNEGQYCALKQVWDGSDNYAEIGVPKKNIDEERLIEVALSHKRK